MTNQCQWLRPKDGAKYANVSLRTFMSWIYTRGLKYSRISGAIIISTASIDAFIESYTCVSDGSKET